MKQIRRGHMGETVSLWQTIVGVPDNGVFDEETESATKQWQAQRGLQPDGVVGAKTWAIAGYAGEKRVEAVRTPISEHDYVVAFLRAYPFGPPTKAQAGVAFAQYMQETSGKACFSFNIGNAKDYDQDGYDYFCLNGVWEGFAPEVAQGYIARGEAIWDPNPAHHQWVGEGKVSIVFPPPHPMSRFRAFPDLASSMRHHLELLQHGYPAAWECLRLGKARECALALGNGTRRYYTGSPNVYAAGMQKHFNDFMQRETYEDAIAAIAQDDIQTLPGLPDTVPELPDDADPTSDRIVRTTDPALYFLDRDDMADDDGPPDAA